MVEGGGFEPPKAEPADLQSDPFDRSGTPPLTRCSLKVGIMTLFVPIVNCTGNKNNVAENVSVTLEQTTLKFSSPTL
jgi:hypothetical protein